jgi:hypothetical protein
MRFGNKFFHAGPGARTVVGTLPKHSSGTTNEFSSCVPSRHIMPGKFAVWTARSGWGASAPAGSGLDVGGESKADATMDR